jgi:hypothetical protein
LFEGKVREGEGEERAELLYGEMSGRLVGQFHLVFWWIGVAGTSLAVGFTSKFIYIRVSLLLITRLSLLLYTLYYTPHSSSPHNLRLLTSESILLTLILSILITHFTRTSNLIFDGALLGLASLLVGVNFGGVLGFVVGRVTGWGWGLGRVAADLAGEEGKGEVVELEVLGVLGEREVGSRGTKGRAKRVRRKPFKVSVGIMAD